ncbi:4-hydroxy-tetrahydrodipicolinate synthase [Clostridium sp. MD294]|uniref:4-hydroxy-tetrahydrodipicolinate synthase n=1 Tax=Clostridium sp. MD294 TaxID=97138 RepID=UPI0002CC2D48|nr:4-hydroxy-tetrahydrodipicolinate synthase [Clostridium sp. MD294]NDO45373.1 4-hydroxy-tetrahydrodipicolinate synthase [Clostridium sp. MD294]USF30986.1 4-hydroxy-tetrahydrodipicolinate synthase [Clostridium sp. MD294]
MTEIKGIIAAMQTPMYPDGSINEKEMRKQINRQIDAGVDAVFCLGTNGEFYIMNEQEKIDIMKIFVDEVAGRVPVYAGTGCISTKDTIILSKKAKEIGVDVLSVITPYFAAIDQNELYEHYSALSEAVDLPIVMYNIPARTGASIAPKTVGKLAKNCKNIVGVKDSSGNFNNILQYIDETKGSDFSVLSGNDALILWTLLAGGKGGITAIANILPTVMVSIYQNYLKGNMDAAKQAQSSIAAIRDCFKYGNPNSIVKCATNLIGQPVGPCRKPFGMVSEQAEKEIMNVINTHYAEYIGK